MALQQVITSSNDYLTDILLGKLNKTGTKSQNEGFELQLAFRNSPQSNRTDFKRSIYMDGPS